MPDTPKVSILGCIDNRMDRVLNTGIGAKRSSSKKRKKKMAKVEIRRFYGLFEVYVDGVLVETFVALWAAKEYVAKLVA